jgi:hypothetical protein
MLHICMAGLLPFLSQCGAQAPIFPVVTNITSPLSVAVLPSCSFLNATNATEINTGIEIEAIMPVSRLPTCDQVVVRE